MKIGILTFHCAHNYGAVLQAYALQRKISDLGFEVEIIKYEPKYLQTPYKVVSLRRILSRNLTIMLKRLVIEALTLRTRFIRNKNFEAFIENKLKISKTFKNQIIPEDYDIYIFGSDQIWNPRITKGFDEIFFGNFKSRNEAKKITYAASMASTEFSKSDIKYISKSLLNFDGLSVREKHLIKLLQPLTNKKIQAVVDPTILIEEKEWNEIALKPEINQNYVLIYQVKTSPKAYQIAESIAKQTGGVVIELKAFINELIKTTDRPKASPEEFLGWIKYADCIITTSFHATVFSVIFERSFYTLKLDDALDNRSKEFLKEVGLEERFISPTNEIMLTTPNYTESRKSIDKIKENSLSYLMGHLSL